MSVRGPSPAALYHGPARFSPLPACVRSAVQHFTASRQRCCLCSPSASKEASAGRAKSSRGQRSRTQAHGHTAPSQAEGAGTESVQSAWGSVGPGGHERCSGPVGLPCLTFASMAWMRSEWPASSFRLQLGVGGSRQPMGGEQVQNQNSSAEGGVAGDADRSAGEGKATWQWPPPREGLLPASLPPGLPSNPSCEGLILLPN